MRKFLSGYPYLLAIAGVIVVLDQWTKTLVRSNLLEYQVWTPYSWSEPYFRIVHWHNTGAAFGMLQQFGGVFMVLSIIVSLFIIFYYPRVPAEDRALRLAMGLQLGGAVGNLIDRITQGYVTDFISLLAAWNMPVFNIADLSITVGVIVLLIGFWMQERRASQAALLKEPTPGPDSQVPTRIPEEQSGE